MLEKRRERTPQYFPPFSNKSRRASTARNAAAFNFKTKSVEN